MSLETVGLVFLFITLSSGRAKEPFQPLFLYFNRNSYGMAVILFFTHWVFIQTYGRGVTLPKHVQDGLLRVVGFGFGVPFGVLLVAAIVVSMTSAGVLENRMRPSRARWTFFAQTLGSLCAIPCTALLVRFVPGYAQESLWFYVWFPVAGTIVFLIAGTLFAGACGSFGAR